MTYEPREKQAFLAAVKEMTKLFQIRDLDMDVGRSEHGPGWRMAFVGYMVAYKDCFIIDPAGQGMSPSGQKCLTNRQIKEKLKLIPKHKRKSMRKEEKIVHEALQKKDFTFLTKKEGRALLPQGDREYKSDFYVRFEPVSSVDDILNEEKNRKFAYIDFVIRLRGRLVILEVDERQHKGRKDNINSGDMTRIGKIMKALRRDRIDLPILVIRYNPHEHTIEEDGVTRKVKISTLQEKKRRIEKVLAEIESMDLSDIPPFQIEHRYYDAITDANGKEVAIVSQERKYKQILSEILQNNSRTLVPQKRKR